MYIHQYSYTLNINNGMKVALVIHGHFRNFDKLWEDWKKYLIDPIKPDVFAFAWGDSLGHHVPAHHTSDNWTHPGYNLESPEVTQELIDNVYTRLLPKKLIIENFCDYESMFSNIIDNPKYANAINDDVIKRPKGILSMVWSRCKAINAKREYEKANNFVYDLVIVTRWDVGYKREIKLTTDFIDPRIINAVGGPHNRPWDWWTIGPSYLIDKFGDQWDGIDELTSVNKFLCEPHLWQKAWFEHKNIPWRGMENDAHISRI